MEKVHFERLEKILIRLTLTVEKLSEERVLISSALTCETCNKAENKENDGFIYCETLKKNFYYGKKACTLYSGF